MGRLRDMVIGLEDEWYEKANYHIGSCESYDEFRQRMKPHRNLMIHFDDEEYYYLELDAWQEKWSKYNVSG